ncbi:MAG: molybdopterin molybdotransferase MoeA [Oscillospiraceae bacterium]
MLTVMTAGQAREALEIAFGAYRTAKESVSLGDALGRVLAEPVIARENVPDFDRSMVDGYAVCASDTFGCSENTPAMLRLIGKAEMGESQTHSIAPGESLYVPTGGALPAGGDAMVMLEYAETCGDGFVYLEKPAAPGMHVIFRGDDMGAGQCALERGKCLRPQDIGVLAALGYETVPVYRKPKVAILSTGTELLPVGGTPTGSQVRDVNGPALAAAVAGAGGEAVFCGIFRDDEEAIFAAASKALADCDMVLISGGSSVGEQDLTRRIIDRLAGSTLLFHGLAVKPGKPTIAATVGGKPVFGLPGHPVSAYMIFEIFVRPVLRGMMGCDAQRHAVTATLAQNLPSNHGREEYVPVALNKREGKTIALPIAGKSGLMSTLAQGDGYLQIDRNCEGLEAGTAVSVTLF